MIGCSDVKANGFGGLLSNRRNASFCTSAVIHPCFEHSARLLVLIYPLHPPLQDSAL